MLFVCFVICILYTVCACGSLQVAEGRWCSAWLQIYQPSCFKIWLFHAHFCPFEHIDCTESFIKMVYVHLKYYSVIYVQLLPVILVCLVQTQPDFTDLFTCHSMQYGRGVVERIMLMCKTGTLLKSDWIMQTSKHISPHHDTEICSTGPGSPAGRVCTPCTEAVFEDSTPLCSNGPVSITLSRCLCYYLIWDSSVPHFNFTLIHPCSDTCCTSSISVLSMQLLQLYDRL